MDILQDKTLYYTLLLFSNFLIVFSMIPLVYETSLLKMTLNIPFFTLVCLGVAFIIFTFISFIRGYWVHMFIYIIAIICVIILFINKQKYDGKNIILKKEIKEIKYKLEKS